MADVEADMGMAEYPEIRLFTLDKVFQIGSIGRRKNVMGEFRIDAFDQRCVMGDDDDPFGR